MIPRSEINECFGRGKSFGDSIAAMLERGASKVQVIESISQYHGMDLKWAKEVVEASASWAAHVEKRDRGAQPQPGRYR